MPLLGTLALWLALLVGVWGALAGFVGELTGRAALAHSARHAVFAMCGALLVAVVSLEWALFQHDFNVEYVAAYTSRICRSSTPGRPCTQAKRAASSSGPRCCRCSDR